MNLLADLKCETFYKDLQNEILFLRENCLLVHLTPSKLVVAKRYMCPNGTAGQQTCINQFMPLACTLVSAPNPLDACFEGSPCIAQLVLGSG